MITGIHLLLTYACNYECDHCFLYCGPFQEGTFKLSQLQSLFDEIKKVDSITSVYFEGGEPFLYYPLMLAGINIAHHIGLDIGIVSNAYWATSEEDAAIWLEPLCKFNIADLSISDDTFHFGEEYENLAKHAIAAAKKLNLPVGTLCVEKPDPDGEEGPMYKGRAADKLTEGLPRKNWHEFTECPHEDLENPGRVHIDPQGNIHLCQGVSIGNIWVTPLSELIRNYQPESHPICGPLIRGGPAQLAREYNVDHQDQYVDECHFCYNIRKSLIDRFPQYLTPKQVYGLEQDS